MAVDACAGVSVAAGMTVLTAVAVAAGGCGVEVVTSNVFVAEALDVPDVVLVAETTVTWGVLPACGVATPVATGGRGTGPQAVANRTSTTSNAPGVTCKSRRRSGCSGMDCTSPGCPLIYLLSVYRFLRFRAEPDAARWVGLVAVFVDVVAAGEEAGAARRPEALPAPGMYWRAR